MRRCQLKKTILYGKVIPIDDERAEFLYPLRMVNLDDEYLIISDNKHNVNCHHKYRV